MHITLFLLKEKEMEDEVKIHGQEPEDEVKIMQEPEDETTIQENKLEEVMKNKFKKQN